ncbi:MAG: multiheme c-type cytochrome [Paracoccaceae bacterium]
MPLPVVADADKTPEYVGSEVCKDCHLEAYEDWQNSHHALAWTDPASENVIGNFSQTTFDHRGIVTTFSTVDGIPVIESDGPNGMLTQYPVAGVAGIAPLQQYLLETEPGRLQSFDVAWNAEEQKWYHLYPDQDLTSDNGLHWTGPYKNWNARCAECHATGFEKNYSTKDKTYSSTQVEIGVGCEACHGPGEAHLAWTKDSNIYNAADWTNVGQSGFTMDFSQGAEATVQQCASCHSRREPYGDGNPLPGTPFHDAYRLSTLREGLYHADGQILDEVYVYGSFLQSKMYDQGVSCSNCHTPHSATVKADDNSLCTQCHSASGNPDFPTLTRADYDTPDHHYHPQDSEGAQCKSCHMIERTYMGIDGRRDHSFRVPRPDLSAKIGTPNTCSDCHQDETARWAAQKIENWYPDGRHTQPHYGELLHQARLDAGANAQDVLELAFYSEMPGIVRASALDLIVPLASPQIAEIAAPLLADPDPVVRVSAIAIQRSAPDNDAAQRLIPLLSDPVKSVRIAAAREFLGLKIVHLPGSIRQDLNAAMSEWQTSLALKTDFPETQMVMAGVALTTRQFEAAVSAFRETVDLDPQMIQAWTMIARIHAALGNRPAALETLDAAMAANPDDITLPLLRADLQ